MYEFLRRRLPAPLAGALMVLWYTTLLWAILLKSVLPTAPFHYLGM
jgi:hypothetical protein